MQTAAHVVLNNLLHPQLVSHNLLLLSETVSDHLQVAVIDELKKLLSAKKWKFFDIKLTMIVVVYVLEAEENKPLPTFDSSEIIREYRII